MPGRFSRKASNLGLLIAVSLINALFVRSDLLWGLLSLVVLVGCSHAIARAFGSRGLSETVLVVFMALTGQLLMLGYSLSRLNALGSTAWWFGGSMCLGAAVLGGAAVPRRRTARPVTTGRGGFDISSRAIRSVIAQTKAESPRSKLFTLAVLMATMFIVSGLNLYVVLSTPPGTWDGLTYHAARVAYYLQHGNLDPYPANYWAQAVHPKNATVLVIYAYLMSGRNENMMQIVQFVAYCVSVVGIYGISRRAAITRTGSLFAAATFGLLIEVVMEATTVQNDLLLASYVGIMVYSLLSFGHDGRLRYLGLFAAALGVALGIKASALLAVPSILVVLGCMLAWLRNDGRSRHSKHRTALSLTALVGAGLLLFTLPAGYVENFRQYQHPLGPVNVRAIHTFENRGLSTVLENGGKNGVRYGIDFANLDGLPRLPAVVKVNRFVRDVLIRAFDSMSVHLVEESESRRPFDPGRPPSSHEDHANWGILGWALILPGVVAVAFGVLRTRRIPRLLSLAFLVFLIAQSFSGPYDPWRGRYFVVAGLFAVPVAGCLFDRLTKRAAVAYVILIALLGSANAVSAVCFRDGRSLIPFDGSKSIMSMNRLEQLTVRRPFMYDIVANFERLVPASASVGLVLGDNEGEYLFFGEKLTRKIVPLRNRRTVPPDVQYVVFQGHLLPALPGEVGLGRGWYLRKLPSR